MLPVSFEIWVVLLSMLTFNWRHQWWWMMQTFGVTIRLQSVQISPGGSTFPPQGFSQPLFLIYSSLPSPSFIPSEISCSCLDFTVRKPNTRTQKGGGLGGHEGRSEWGEAHKQSGNWVWRCHSRLRALALFHSFSLAAVHILCGGRAEHLSAQWCVRSRYTVQKSHSTCIQNRDMKLNCLFFRYHVIFFEFPTDDHTLSGVQLRCSAHVSA